MKKTELMIFFVLQFNGLTKNTRTVIRIDLIVESNLDCGCWCELKGTTGKDCACPESISPRTTHLSSAKRDLQSDKFRPTRDATRELGFDEMTVALFVNDYYINDDYYTFPVQYMPFDSLCHFLNCQDYTGCYTAITPGKVGNTYKDRNCEFVEVSCDDGDDQTNDRCVPPRNPSSTNIPNCIHTGLDEPLNGYCYYVDGPGYKCQQSCTSDDDCDAGGACYEIDCSVNALQQENLESANSSKHQSVGSLSPLQLFGIIGGCVGFVVMVVFVVVIYKKFFQDADTIASLQVPLN